MADRETVEIALRNLAPKLPRHEFSAIVDHALDSAGLKQASAETAAWLSMIAYIRHVLTDYDQLLDDGYDRESARHFVLDDMNAILQSWGSRRTIEDV